MRKILALATGLLLLGGPATTATASHPTQICLDVEPDRAYPLSNDDQVDFLRAYVGATDDGHPPEHDGCVTAEAGAAAGTEIDFEIIGAGDFDDSNTPESPDFGCTMPEDKDYCSIEAPSRARGDQTIAGWIDFDRDDSTVELDTGEQQPDEDTDATDVALWTWSRCHGCLGLTIRFDPDRPAFMGRVIEHFADCYARRTVRIWKVRRSSDDFWGKTLSGARGYWRVSTSVETVGRFYAVARKTEVNEYFCPRIRSETIRVP